MSRNRPSDFWNRVDRSIEGGCWTWTGRTKPDGYAQWRINGRSVYVHRWSYEAVVGPVPDGLVLDHLCRNRACVNPSHLEPVTGHVNTLRGERSARSHCPSGHPYDGANTYRWKGRRYCRACINARTSVYEKRTKRWLRRSAR